MSTMWGRASALQPAFWPALLPANRAERAGQKPGCSPEGLPHKDLP
jgi:hypothetical protein